MVLESAHRLCHCAKQKVLPPPSSSATKNLWLITRANPSASCLRQITWCDTLQCSHGSRSLSQLWCYKDYFKWDKAPKTSTQLCCSSPTQQKNPTILPIMLSDVGNVGISCVKANFYCVKSAFCIQTLFKECPALLCKLEMHYIFYTIVFVSLKPGVYSNLCLPFNWEEGKGPVSRLSFYICGMECCN